MRGRRLGTAAEFASAATKRGLAIPPEAGWGELIRDLLAEGRTATFRVRGISMLPTLRDGDLVTLERLDGKGAKTGDMIAFMRGPCLCLHRVIAVVHDGASGRISSYVTAGDGLNAHDGRRPARTVIGKVIAVQSASGGWSPSSLLRRAQSHARVFLSLHPGARDRLRRIRGALRNLALTGSSGARAGMNR